MPKLNHIGPDSTVFLASKDDWYYLWATLEEKEALKVKKSE